MSDLCDVIINDNSPKKENYEKVIGSDVNRDVSLW